MLTNVVMGTQKTRAKLKVQSWAIPSGQPCPENSSVSLGAAGAGLVTLCALQSLCSAAGGMQEDLPVGGSVCMYLDAAGAAAKRSPSPGALVTSWDGAPSGLTLLGLLSLLESVWVIFAAYCHDLAKSALSSEPAVKLPAGKMHFSAVCTGHCLEIPLICSFAFLPFDMEKKFVPCLPQAYEEPVTAAQLWFDLNGSKAGCEGKSRALLGAVLAVCSAQQSWDSRGIQMSWTLRGPNQWELLKGCYIGQERLCCGAGTAALLS